MTKKQCQVLADKLGLTLHKQGESVSALDSEQKTVLCQKNWGMLLTALTIKARKEEQGAFRGSARLRKAREQNPQLFDSLFAEMQKAWKENNLQGWFAARTALRKLEGIGASQLEELEEKVKFQG